jgi:hypothetical protein
MCRTLLISEGVSQHGLSCLGTYRKQYLLETVERRQDQGALLVLLSKVLTPASMKGYTIRLGCFRASDTTLDIPRRCPKASSSSRGYLPPITAHTERRRLMHGCGVRIASAWFPGSTCEARQTDVFACERPFLSTSYALPLRTSSRELRNPPYLRTSKDKDGAPQKSGGSGVPSSPRRRLPRRSCSSEASSAWLQFSAGPLACLGTCELECGFRLNVRCFLDSLLLCIAAILSAPFLPSRHFFLCRCLAESCHHSRICGAPTTPGMCGSLGDLNPRIDLAGRKLTCSHGAGTEARHLFHRSTAVIRIYHRHVWTDRSPDRACIGAPCPAAEGPPVQCAAVRHRF